MKTTRLIHIVRLAPKLRSNTAAEKKSSFMEMLETFKSLADTGYKSLLAVGIFVVLGYLLASIQFYPAGVTIGDAFFFLMVAFAFGFSYVLSIMAGALIAQAARYAYQRYCTKKIVKIILVLCAIALLAIASLSGGELALTAIEALVGFSISGYFLVLLIESLDKPAAKKDKKWINLFLWLGVLFAPLLLSAAAVRNMNENIVMPNSGLRLMNVTLKVSEENYDILASAATGQNLAVLGCSASASGRPERMIHGVNLLWHGIGERSLVELPTSTSPNLIVELKREGVFALRNYRGAIERCLELNSDVLFEKGSAQLSSDQDDLKDVIAVIKQTRKNIEKIQIIGHADALGYAGGAQENNQLALDRAKKVKEIIDAARLVAVGAVTAEGHGAREPKTLCKDWPVKATLSECLAPNRRVELRIKFASIPAKPDGPEQPETQGSRKSSTVETPQGSGGNASGLVL